MPINERLIDAAMPIVRSLRPADDFDRARRVDVGLDNEGNPNIDGRRFFELESPDGALWRIRISNTGTLSTRKVT